MAANDLTGFSELNALLGRGTEFEGKLTFVGRVRLEGKVRGEIFGDEVLILSEGAEIDAEIEVGTLIVRGGTLRGNVRATQLIEVHAPARVFGNLSAPQLLIDKGALFEGQCTMAQPSGPARLVPAPE